jgi:transposase
MRAWHLQQQGWGQRDIAAALGVTEAAVSRWMAAARQEGPQALQSRPRGRPPAKLTAAQRDLIPEFLWHRTEAYGFRGEVGPATASPGSSKRSSGSTTTPTMSAGC